MGYASYLQALLEPLGIYTFAEGSFSGGELAAIGAALDQIAAELEEIEQEALVPTAEGRGLSEREALFARRPAAPTLVLRRAAITALMQIGSGNFTRTAINRALKGCGVNAVVAETGEKGCLRVTFPDTAGIPAEFDQISKIILDIVPCHLETEFYFRYLTWVELEARFTSFSSIEQENYTWQQLELAV